MNTIRDKFRNKLENEDYVYGVFMKTSDPMFVEINGIAKFDYVILDTEHGPTDIEHQQNNVRACQARGIASIIRVPQIDENMIGKALDIGADGIQVSQIRTAEDVKKVIEYARFYPLGKRGVCRFVRAADYSAMNRGDYFENANKSLIILQIEGAEAIANLDKILEIEGYDVLFIGPYDLSQSLGVPGQIKHPKVLSAMIDIVERAKKMKKRIGTFTDDFEMVEKWKTLGVQYISHSTDAGLYYDSLSTIYNKLNECGVPRKVASVLDCTLRDGGYINNWSFGLKNITRIINYLIDSNVDFIECGYLTGEKKKEIGTSKFNSIEEVNEFLPKIPGKNFALMFDYGTFDVNNIPVFDGIGVNCIRLAFHKKDLEAALIVGQNIIKKGYKLFLQAMVTMTYTDMEFMYLIKKCNEYKPYSLFIVDSFGVMKKGDVLRFYNILEANLNKDIIIGLHTHNNLQLAFSNAISLMENTKRALIIDSSIHGMGRGAGNLNTEIFIEYLNDYHNGNYNLKPILEANDQVIEKIHSTRFWGYSLPYYLSAKHNCHPNYAKHLANKNNLTIDDINAIFDMLDVDKKIQYDSDYIDNIYLSFLENRSKDIVDFEMVKNIFKNKKVLMICPGKSSFDNVQKMKKEVDNDTLVVSINFEYPLFKTNYIFFGNNKRMKDIDKGLFSKIIATSNIPNNKVYAKVSYGTLLNEDNFVKDNSGLMFLKLMALCEAKEVVISGMDGYTYDPQSNYMNEELVLNSEKETIDNLNYGLKIVLQKISKILNYRKL